MGHNYSKRTQGTCEVLGDQDTAKTCSTETHTLLWSGLSKEKLEVIRYYIVIYDYSYFMTCIIYIYICDM